jgi:hypothetical protein
MAKKEKPLNYYEVNTWMVHEACNTMEEAMSLIVLIARSSDHVTQQALHGVLTVLVDSQRTLNEYMEGPDVEL